MNFIVLPLINFERDNEEFGAPSHVLYFFSVWFPGNLYVSLFISQNLLFQCSVQQSGHLGVVSRGGPVVEPCEDSRSATCWPEC